MECARGEGRKGGVWCCGKRGPMSKAHVKTKYDAAANAATATLVLPLGDLKVKASCADHTFVQGAGGSLRGVSFGVEKPGAFMIDYDVQTEVHTTLPSPLWPSLSSFVFTFGWDMLKWIGNQSVRVSSIR